MAGSVCPEFLPKDELVFEVRARGAEPASDVASLRTQLRGLLASRFVSTWPSALVVEKEIDVCKNKFEEWDGRLEEFRDEPPSGRLKLRGLSRLLHLQGRVSLLLTTGNVKGEGLDWLKETSDFLKNILIFFSKTSVSTLPSTDVARVNETAPVPSSATPVPPVLPPPIMSSSITPYPSHTSYHKLPNPLTPLLQALPSVDGLEVHQLLKFLVSLFRIIEMPGVDEFSILSLLVPYCRPPLSDLLSDVFSRKGNFEEFHRATLEMFVPGRMREDLKMQMFYRSQGLRESLAHYVSDVRDARRVLRVGLSESETVQVILDGITPEERSRLVFSTKPTTFSGLDQLVVAARNVQLIDSRREEMSRASQARSSRPLVGQVSAPSDPPQQRRPSFVCFGCGQRGHIRKFCRQVPTSSSVPKNGEGGGLPR